MAKKRKKPEPFSVVPIQYLAEGAEARAEKVAKIYEITGKQAKRVVEAYNHARAAVGILEAGGEIESALWRLVDAAGLLSEIDDECAGTGRYVVKKARKSKAR